MSEQTILETSLASVYHNIMLSTPSPSEEGLLLKSITVEPYIDVPIELDLECDGTITYEVDGEKFKDFEDVIKRLEFMYESA